MALASRAAHVAHTVDARRPFKKKDSLKEMPESLNGIFGATGSDTGLLRVSRQFPGAKGSPHTFSACGTLRIDEKARQEDGDETAKILGEADATRLRG